jgi:hypothetical protein
MSCVHSPLSIRCRGGEEEDITVIQDLAVAVMAKIQLRMEIAARSRAEGGRNNIFEFNTLQREQITTWKQAKQAEEYRGQIEGPTEADPKNGSHWPVGRR